MKKIDKKRFHISTNRFILGNNKGEFICRAEGRLYISTDDFTKAITYKYATNALNLLKDKRYWEYKKIKIKGFKPVEVRFTMEYYEN